MTEPLPWHARPLRQVASAYMNARLGHAWLIYGVAGLGKEQFARELSQTLLCSAPQVAPARVAPCGRCGDCRQFAVNQHPDFLQPHPEEGKRVLTVDAIRELNDFAQLTRHRARHKVVLVLAADTMNKEAQNALLKTLEEPPSGTVLLLVTHHPARLLLTIRSRCQKLPFAAPGREQAVAWLRKQGISEPETALDTVGNGVLQATGSAGDEKISLAKTWAGELAGVIAGQKSPIPFSEQFADLDSAMAFQQWLFAQCRLALREALLQQPRRGVFKSLPLDSLTHLSTQLQELARIQDRSLRWNWQLAGLLYGVQTLAQQAGRAA